MARSVKQLEAWAQLLELCDDDVQVFRTTSEMRTAVLEVERELARLHKMEDCAIRLARMFKRLRDADDTSHEWDNAMENLWDNQEAVCRRIEALCPEVFSEEAMKENAE